MSDVKKAETVGLVRGMHDLFGADGEIFNWIMAKAASVAKLHAFSSIHTPILEFASLFERNLGDESDIVSKEIYKFADRGGDILALRPEFTAGVVRAIVGNSLHNNPLPIRLFASGPLFRYDRPQAGRYRQFHQVNWEIIGYDSLQSDLSCVLIAEDFLKSIGLRKNDQVKLKINFLGNDDVLNGYSAALMEYLQKNQSKIHPESAKKLPNNPLRVLDSKHKEDKEILKDAPILSDFYTAEYNAEVSRFVSFLDQLKIEYTIDNSLIRGMDYYNGLVFEYVVSNSLISSNSAQPNELITILGGGRYNSLLAQISGNKVNLPAIGFAAGVERLVMLINNYSEKIINKSKVLVGMITGSDEKSEIFLRQIAIKISELAECGSDFSFLFIEAGNFEKKLQRANKLGCKYIIICGDRELADSQVKIKNMDGNFPNHSSNQIAITGDILEIAKQIFATIDN